MASSHAHPAMHTHTHEKIKKYIASHRDCGDARKLKPLPPLTPTSRPHLPPKDRKCKERHQLHVPRINDGFLKPHVTRNLMACNKPTAGRAPFNKSTQPGFWLQISTNAAMLLLCCCYAATLLLSTSIFCYAPSIRYSKRPLRWAVVYRSPKACKPRRHQGDPTDRRQPPGRPVATFSLRPPSLRDLCASPG